MKILIVEDEKKVQQFLKKGLGNSNMTVEAVSTIKDMIALLANNVYDVLILDRMLGGVDSVAYLADVRKKVPKAKIIILSALSEVDDKVEGLSHGADDYLSKPFHIDELVARINALTRRGAGEGTGNTVLTLQDLTIYLDSQRVERAGKRLSLTAKEYKLLALLVKNTDKIFSKNDLLKEVWEISYDPGSNIVEVLVNHLRAKVDKDFPVALVHSRRGDGYWAGTAPLAQCASGASRVPALRVGVPQAEGPK